MNKDEAITGRNYDELMPMFSDDRPVRPEGAGDAARSPTSS